MHLILMGTGTSHGIPVIGCTCAVCTSRNKKDKRYRCSAYLTNRGEEKKYTHFVPTDIVIDTGPEFRIQALTYKINRLDAVLLTHSHADHLHGLDDLRIFSFVKPPKGHDICEPHGQAMQHDNMTQHDTAPQHDTAAVSAGNIALSERNYCGQDMNPLPIYTNPTAIEDIKYRFAYVFTQAKEGGGKPKLAMNDCTLITPDNPLVIHSVSILPVPLLHGSLEDSGWLMSEVQTDGKKHSIAYLTDCSEVPDSSIKLILENAGILDHLVIDGLREKPHSTHFSFDEALACAEKIGAKHTWFTHICHNMSHRDIEKYVAMRISNYPVLDAIVSQGGSVGPAWDGLELTVKPVKE